jgi:hypothetical protein
MSNVDLNKLMSTMIFRVDNEVLEEIKDVKDWTTLFRVYDELQERAITDPIVEVLLKYPSFFLHAQLRRVQHVIGDRADGLFDTLENAEMKIPKWVSRCNADLVRALHTCTHSLENGLVQCDRCFQILLDVHHPDFEADVATYESFADWNIHKKRRRCTSCETTGESVMVFIEPMILVCGQCGLPLTYPSLEGKVEEFHHMLLKKHHHGEY